MRVYERLTEGKGKRSLKLGYGLSPCWLLSGISSASLKNNQNKNPGYKVCQRPAGLGLSEKVGLNWVI